MTPAETAHDGAPAHSRRTVHPLIRALTRVRHQRGVTLAQLAARLAVAEVSMANWESGAGLPLTTNMLAWANELDCTIYVVDQAGVPSHPAERRGNGPLDNLERYRPLAHALRTARERSDLSQKDVADELDVAVSAMSQWESADRIPRFNHLTTWADFVGCRLKLDEGNPLPTSGHTTTLPHASLPDTSAPAETRISDQDDPRETPTGRHHITMPALLPLAGALRAAAGNILDHHPRRRDAQEVIAEIVTVPLIEHRCPCCAPAQITLTIDIDEHRIRLEVTYYLTLTHPPRWTRREIDNYGLGLAIINAHCGNDWGTGINQTGPIYHADTLITWWAELNHAPPLPTPLVTDA